MRRLLAALVVLSLIFSGNLYAYETGRTTMGPGKRVLTAEGRGLLNLVGLPLEVIRTPIAEARRHKRIWPITFLPRMITNIFARATSSVQDIVIAPFVLPFSNDMTPLTEPMGLPDYPWQIGETDL